MNIRISYEETSESTALFLCHQLSKLGKSQQSFTNNKTKERFSIESSQTPKGVSFKVSKIHDRTNEPA